MTIIGAAAALSVAGMVAAGPTPLALQVLDARLHELVPVQPTLERVATGFGFTEGVTWVPRDGGYLLFSDIPANVIYRWAPGDAQARVFLEKAGYQGHDTWRAGMPFNNGKAEGAPDYEAFNMFGSNGNTLDPQGRLVIATWGGRSIVRVEADGRRTLLADRHQGRRLGGPNDVVVRRNGDIYFTDTFGGMLKLEQDPSREIDHNAVFRLRDGVLTEVAADMPNVNGLAFSPDESTLYVTGSGDNHLRAYPVQADGLLGEGRLFCDLSTLPGPGITDGLRVDVQGNVWTTAPGGVRILAPDGTALGHVPLPEPATNLEFGGADRRMLYISTPTSIYRMPTRIAGAR
ncbi:MAG: Gluconolactonase [Stenotrophomonas maltophilia]|uniref:Gluconolactonase n=1 Tax=Stenotrophomonas maltophilia TaxID=40324 RepID=A0A7V8FJR2_STEMA|nr:MAG: Gluconolactonase [Stenotrophomonas maltophilia]